MGEATYEPLAYGWRVLFVLALLLGAAVWARRRWGGGVPGRSNGWQLRIVESLALGPQRQVHVLAVGGRHYLIGVTSQTVTFLTELESEEGWPKHYSFKDEEAAEVDGPSTPGNFEAILREAEGGTPEKETPR